MPPHRSLPSWLFCISSSLGIYFGLTIFFIFTFVYDNNHAGMWGLISAVLASLCLHLHLLSSDNRLSGWYSAPQLFAIATFSFICFSFSIGFTSWYIVYAAVHRIPLLPVSTSYYLAAVWSGMGAKWSFTLFLLSYRYGRMVRGRRPFLIVGEGEEGA